MAKERSTTVDTGGKIEEKATQSEGKLELKKQTESVYTIEELSANANYLFGVRAECVVAALKAAGIKECTVSKTKEIINKFMGKEIK